VLARRRNEYLEVIGIDVWVPRRGAASASESARDGTSEPDAAATLRAAEDSADSVGTPPQPLAVASFADAAKQGVPAARAAPVALPVDVAVEWDRLRSEVATCTRCALHSSRTQGVFGVGNPQADWLVIGEAPGAEEDRRGEPFVGRAGHLLDAMLKAIDLSRETNVFIANVLKSRPPGNRDPKPEEVAACLPYLMRQIALMRPRLILAVGRIAAQNLLATDMSLGRLRGKVHHFGELNTPLIVTYHPAYLLRSPADKRKAWEDLKFAQGLFRQVGLGNLGHRT
jgi:uracil-DNA glycosylase